MLYSSVGLIPRKLDGMAFRPTRLRERREQKGLTQQQLGEAVGLTNPFSAQVQIARYETGKRHPDHKMIVKLADALNTTADWLLGIADYPERLTALHYRVAEAFNRGDRDEIIRLLREHLRQQDLGKDIVPAKKPRPTQ